MAHKNKTAYRDYLTFGDGEFRRPVVKVPVESGRPELVIGPVAGRAILENIDVIRDFVREQEIMKHALQQMCEHELTEWE